ncbi:hypothetical protein CEUSTIGMA_g10806.t1 [Chlamydomonas eustigma]|uniref:Elongator complex protein 3 n=1 Tax=Chlamydomonas eustigma TaxID=1157962 RepID=A0A250XJW6_9CHLO|nr:hypothetical protein CEUSTIGMA_g10806.t1 [Chlamydomonas eustigma]|eukprot:GAX83381.1 hypothetical protein CEUSTIGMA_g10806.t1 [Chlamydomonas eustigma]
MGVDVFHGKVILSNSGKVKVQLPPDEARVRAIAEVVQALINGVREGKDVDLNALKMQSASKYILSRAPKLVEIIAAVPEEYRSILLPQLRAKPIRTASGIAVVAVMSKPHRCPHIATTGNICIYCPGGPDSDFEYSTQSYTGYEPTSMRAIRARYNPYVQARGRVDQLRKLGHSVDKVEFILMGGTFMSLPSEYRDYFVRNLHDALSGHSSSNVKEAIAYSEESHTKCIGLTIETRPDYCLTPHLKDMLSYGCTRLEMGVQSIYEDVARDTNRGHTVESVKECFCLAKDAGFKVVCHMMPDLPNVGWERDLECFREFFENPEFRTDGLKLYPTLVIRGTGLYELWKRGLYRNYHPDKLVDLVARILALLPPWCLGPDDSRQPELRGRCSVVRELHVYGTAIAVHARDQGKFQHQGYGTLLMEEAEGIARFEHRSTKLAVISGVGTRHYYRKLGYHLEGHYMVKTLETAPSRRKRRT